MNKLRETNPYSFIQGRDFYWLAEYFTGNIYPEFDFTTYQKNDFELIDKHMLIRFGYLGCGIRFYFDTPTGIFNLCDNEFSFIYKTDDFEYNLTNQYELYNDVISYKSMYSDPDFSGNSSNGVSEYHFGYKNKFCINGVTFNFKPIMHIPLNAPAYFTLWLVSDRDLNGQLVIRKNRIKCAEFDAPLLANSGGEATWKIEL